MDTLFYPDKRKWISPIVNLEELSESLQESKEIFVNNALSDSSSSSIVCSTSTSTGQSADSQSTVGTEVKRQQKTGKIFQSRLALQKPIVQSTVTSPRETSLNLVRNRCQRPDELKGKDSEKEEKREFSFKSLKPMMDLVFDRADEKETENQKMYSQLQKDLGISSSMLEEMTLESVNLHKVEIKEMPSQVHLLEKELENVNIFRGELNMVKRFISMGSKPNAPVNFDSKSKTSAYLSCHDTKYIQSDDFILEGKLYKAQPEKLEVLSRELKTEKDIAAEELMSFEVLGSNTILELEKIFTCQNSLVAFQDIEHPSDLGRQSCKLAKNVFTNSFICIEDKVFLHGDTRMKRFGKRLKAWANRAGPKKVCQFRFYRMEDFSVRNLSIRFGSLYCFSHLQDCEHLIVFTGARLPTSDDPIYKSDFPRKIGSWKYTPVLCSVDYENVALWAVVGNHLLPASPMMLCSECLYSFCYDDDQKNGNFKVYPFYQLRV